MMPSFAIFLMDGRPYRGRRVAIRSFVDIVIPVGSDEANHRLPEAAAPMAR